MRISEIIAKRIRSEQSKPRRKRSTRTRRQRRRIAFEKQLTANKHKPFGPFDMTWYVTVYLNSDHWKARRLSRIKRAKYKCNRCRRTRKFGGDLHVHHLSYRNLYSEPNSDLEVLCSECHAIEHEDNGAIDSLTAEYLAIIANS